MINTNSLKVRFIKPSKQKIDDSVSEYGDSILITGEKNGVIDLGGNSELPSLISYMAQDITPDPLTGKRKLHYLGLEYNTNDLWLNDLNPKYAVICQFSDTIEYNPDGSYYGEVSFNRDDEYTYRKTVQHLAAKGTKIFSTYDSESVVIESTVDDLKVLEGNTYTHLYGNQGFNTTYPYFRASRNQLAPKNGFEIVGGGFTRYGNMIVVQMMVRATVAKAANDYWQIAQGFPRPFYVGVPISYPLPEEGKTYNVAHSWHAPMQIIRYGNTTEHYTGWIYPGNDTQKGILRVGLGTTNIPANSTLYISGVYFARKGE